MDKEIGITEREAFEAYWEGTRGHQMIAPAYLPVWQAASKWQRERDAEICRVPEGTDPADIICGEDGVELCNNLADAILNQGSKE